MEMENFREKQRKSYVIMRKTYDFTMAILLLGMAMVMLFAEKLNLDDYIEIDKTLRQLFGGFCLLYGSFRVYRAIKSDY